MPFKKILTTLLLSSLAGLSLAADSVCDAPEQVVFSCLTQDNAVLSLCAARVLTDQDSLQVRVSTPGQPLFDYPNPAVIDPMFGLTYVEADAEFKLPEQYVVDFSLDSVAYKFTWSSVSPGQLQSTTPDSMPTKACITTQTTNRLDRLRDALESQL